MRERITCSGGGIMQPDACARVKILQHAHEELVEQSADVPLEVEQAACTKGMMKMALEGDVE